MISMRSLVRDQDGPVGKRSWIKAPPHTRAFFLFPLLPIFPTEPHRNQPVRVQLEYRYSLTRAVISRGHQLEAVGAMVHGLCFLEVPPKKNNCESPCAKRAGTIKKLQGKEISGTPTELNAFQNTGITGVLWLLCCDSCRTSKQRAQRTLKRRWRVRFFSVLWAIHEHALVLDGHRHNRIFV